MSDTRITSNVKFSIEEYHSMPVETELIDRSGRDLSLRKSGLLSTYLIG